MPKPRTLPSRIAVGALLAIALMLSAAGDSAGSPGDPLEPLNRTTHRFNLAADRVLLRPVAKLYVALTPKFVRIGISNFIVNLTYPSVILNDFLQAKFEQGVQDIMRLAFNSTFGLAGFLDVASGLGLERHDEDFGQTLAVWGVSEIGYLELPAFGPSSVRDVSNSPVAWQTSLVSLAGMGSLVIPLAVVGAVSVRADADGAIEFRNRVAVDTYTFTREAYRQRRTYLVFDGRVPDDEDDFGAVPDLRDAHRVARLFHPDPGDGALRRYGRGFD